MSKGKQAALIAKLGSNMNESAGSLPIEDRFDGFVAGTSQSGEMHLDRIKEDPNQPRKSFDQQALQDLAENVKSHGIQQPIQLRWSESDKCWLIVFGHRRYRAAKLAGLTTIPCTFANEDIDEPTLRVRQLVENCQRENLAPIELAKGLQALSELTGWSNRHIAQELGMTHTTVGRYLGLLDLPEDVQELVETRELAPSIANEILKVGNISEQSTIAHEVARSKMNREEAKARIGKSVRPVVSNRVEKELFANTVNVSVYRNPLVNNLKIRTELLSIIEQIEVEKIEH